MKNIFDVIIVGAGLSGISAGKFIMENGLSIKIVDKGKMPGGRLATRRIKFEGNNVVFDYGCRYIELNSYEFSKALVDLVKSDIIRRWNVISEETYASGLENNNMKIIGKHSMRDIALSMAKDLDIANNVKVVRLDRKDGVWNVFMNNGDNMFAKDLILTMPVPQVIDLFKKSELPIDSDIINNLKKIKYQRTITALVILESESKLNKVGSVKLNNADISYITNNNLKGINHNKTAITIEATNEFSIANWELSDERVIDKMLESSAKWLKGEVLDYQIHRWNYSIPTQSYNKPFEFITNPGPIYIIGDAFKGDNAESAFLSGRAAAKELVEKELLQEIV